MLGKVHGPYLRPDGRYHVVVLHHNEDGGVKARKTISYSKYLEEVKKGLHQYKDWIRPEPKRLSISREEQVRRTQLVQSTCSCCKKEIIIRQIFAEQEIRFCSRNCREKYRRQLKKQQSKITYLNQYVVTINEKKSDKYYIIQEYNEQESYFILADKCITLISEDNNKIKTFHLQYNKKDAVRIRLVPEFKKFFWITETGILVSRRTKKILTQTISPTGYLVHSTKIGGRKGKTLLIRIHRFVGLAFIPNPDEKPFINHIDCNKQNNHHSNLEWCTNIENVAHAIENNLRPTGEDIGSSVFTNNDIIRIRYLYDNKIKPVSEIIQEYNVSPHAIYDCVKRRTYKNIDIC